MSFVHLHVHSEYSLLDGLGKLHKLVARAKELGMPALALTDHGTLFGAIEFYQAAKNAGIRPVIGIETYLSPRRMTDRDAKADREPDHLLLLAESDAGYQNLLKIASAAQLDGFYYKPRIDHEFLETHAEGLIATSGCLAAEVPSLLKDGRDSDAEKKLRWYRELFGRDRFFVELQDHNIPELRDVNRKLIALAPKLDLGFVATNDVHYVYPQDSEAHDILLCIQTGAIVSEQGRMRMSDGSYYLRSPEEMRSLFGDIPGAIENTVAIAERCTVDLGFKGYHLPEFPLPEGETAEGYLHALCEKGMRARFGPKADDSDLRARLDYELSIIHRMGFDTYFLIVWDLCRYAREAQIWYNARGSAAGSLTAYVLEITLVDPMAHGLIFERFLNPARVSMPDIDLDFQDDLRGRMLDYAARRYGSDKVAQIITFGTMAARAAVRDVGRALHIPLPDVDRIAKLIPNAPGKPVTLADAIKDVPALQEEYQQTEYVRNLLDKAANLEGVVRNAGTHAAGVVIADRPLVEYLPLHRPTRGSMEDSAVTAVTQFEMQVLEKLGLLKVDFLGLATLTIMQRACAFIRERHHVDLTLANIPTDDPAIYDLLGRGDVLGVFQVESSGMRRYLTEMKPTRLDHVIAMIALYRPGPIEFIPEYIERMHGTKPVEFRHPALEPILCETYGILIYQEQLMRAVIDLAGYTASEADELRKAVSKKNAEAIQKHRAKFIEGAGKVKQIAAEKAAQIFDDWEGFARYGFNKAHAADYGVICAQTAFLKARYPVEFMTALLSASKNEKEKIAVYIADCSRMGIAVRQPDVSASGWDFSIEMTTDGKFSIRYGLGAVMNVGEGPVKEILEAKKKGGPFHSLDDFAGRVDLRKVGKRALESLIKVGALDSFGNRGALLRALDNILSASANHFRAMDAGQMSLFGSAMSAIPVETIALNDAGAVPKRIMLEWEKELLGLYVSEHPLSAYAVELQSFISHYSGELNEEVNGHLVKVAGLVTRMREYQTHAGKMMCFATIEDMQGAIDLTIFPRLWKKVKEIVVEDAILLVSGKAETGNGAPKVLVESVTTELKIVESVKPPISQISIAPKPSPAHSFNTVPDCEEDWLPPPGDPLEEIAAEGPLPIAVAPADVPPVKDVTPLTALASRPVMDIASGNAKSGNNANELEALPAIKPLAVPSLAARAPMGPNMITIFIRESEDRNKDTRRIRILHSLVTSYIGQDHFAFQVFETGRAYRLEFPDTTNWCPELERRVQDLLGPCGIDIQPWCVH